MAAVDDAATVDPGERKSMTAAVAARDQLGEYVEDVVDLATRQVGHIEVALLWHRRTNALSVFVVDQDRAISFELAVEASEAMEVFWHPYAYAPREQELAS
jgi:hypothetical protein